MLEHYFNPTGPGAALAVTTKGRASYGECLGLADIEAGIEITPETIFDLASGSKWFTATSIVRLSERGAIDLRQPVHEVLPWIGKCTVGRSITVRDLLWHTSGLPDYLEAGRHAPIEHTTATFVAEQVGEWARHARPGRFHNYPNTNYFVLSKVLEAVAGQAYAELVESTLIAPFGLENTFVLGGAREQRRAAMVAKGYRNLGHGLPQIEASEVFPLETVGDGGVFSSLRDLGVWQSAFWGGDIVSEASLAQMTSRGHLDSGEAFPYGLGLQIERHENGQIWFGHGGSWTSSTVLFGRYPKEHTDVTVLSNEFMAPVERITQRALALFGRRPGYSTT